jgi:CMP-2-keto-3-deoxyoctulosonic acid synthetase
MLDEALAPLRREPDVQVVNLMAPLAAECAADPNEIKVVVDRRGDALYFRGGRCRGARTRRSRR